MRTLCTLAALVVATACGPLAQNQPLVSGLKGLANAGSGFWDGTPRDSRETLTRDVIDAAASDLLLFGRVDEDAVSTFTRVSVNGGMSTFVSDEGNSLILQNGVAVATRGLGNDLMGADLAQVYPALVRGSGSAMRIHDYLGGEDQIVRTSYQCEITTLRSAVIEIFQRRHETRVVREACTGDAGRFTNLYWIDAVGRIWQSRQWVSARVGAVEFQRL